MAKRLGTERVLLYVTLMVSVGLEALLFYANYETTLPYGMPALIQDDAACHRQLDACYSKHLWHGPSI
jgi:hypothetical protein